MKFLNSNPAVSPLLSKVRPMTPTTAQGVERPSVQPRPAQGFQNTPNEFIVLESSRGLHCHFRNKVSTYTKHIDLHIYIYIHTYIYLNIYMYMYIHIPELSHLEAWALLEACTSSWEVKSMFSCQASGRHMSSSGNSPNPRGGSQT